MKAAVNKTYISKRMIDRYTEERTKQQSQAKSVPIVPPKTFSED